MIALFVLLAAVAAAAVHGLPFQRDRWVTVSLRAPDMAERALALQFDLRGVYGLGTVKTALLRVGDVDVDALRLNKLAGVLSLEVHPEGVAMLQSNNIYRLWAVELDAGKDKDSLPPLQRVELDKILAQYAHFEIKGAGLYFVHVPISGHLDWPEFLQAIRVPRHGIRPAVPTLAESPAAKYLKNISKNEIIANAITLIDKDEIYATDLYLSESITTRQSASNGIKQASTYLQDRFRSFGIESVTTHTYRADYAPNIIAEIRGTVEPNKYVIVGAHYDSRNANSGDTTGRAPGADDNGSGTSAIVELARVISSLNNTFVYSIRFLLFTGEEQGLLGSEAYAQMISSQGQEVVAFFNADMLGYRIPGGPIEMGMKDRSITQWLLEVSYAIDALYVPELPVKLSSSCCSDYISFYEVGYPAIGFFENPTTASTYPQYHTSQDVISNLDFDQIKLEASAILANLMTFAVPN